MHYANDCKTTVRQAMFLVSTGGRNPSQKKPEKELTLFLGRIIGVMHPDQRQIPNTATSSRKASCAHAGTARSVLSFGLGSSVLACFSLGFVYVRRRTISGGQQRKRS